MNKIRLIRLEKGLTQPELANQSGIDLEIIQKIENSKIKPSQEIISKLSLTLEVLPEQLTNDKQSEKVFELLQLSQLAFIVTPFNIIIPVIIWKLKKKEIIGLNELGKKVINFQITWTILLFIGIFVNILVRDMTFIVLIPFLFHLFNLVIILINVSGGKYFYKPSIKFVR